MHLVVDTNVLVSGLLRTEGHPARIVRAIAGGELRVIYDDRVLGEYREVLARPRFGFAPVDTELFLAQLIEEGKRISAEHLDISLPDEDDRPFIEVAATESAVIVTGNQRDFPSLMNVRVLTPRQLVEELGL